MTQSQGIIIGLFLAAVLSIQSNLTSICFAQQSLETVSSRTELIGPGASVLVFPATRNQTSLHVICIPGLGLCPESYSRVAQEFGKHGYSTHVVDAGKLRRASNGEPRKIDTRNTLRNIHRVVRAVRESDPNAQVVLLGESVGADLAIRIASECEGDIDGIICSSPAWKIYRLPSTALKGVVDMIRRAPVGKPGWAAKGVIRQVAYDPQIREHLSTHPAHTNDFTFTEAVVVKRIMDRTRFYACRLKRTPVLFVQGLNDRLVKPDGTARLFRCIPNPNKTLVVDASAEHLIFEEGQSDLRVIAATVNWLDTVHEGSVRGPEALIVASDTLDGQRLQRIRKLLRIANLQFPDRSVVRTNDEAGLFVKAGASK